VASTDGSAVLRFRSETQPDYITSDRTEHRTLSIKSIAHLQHGDDLYGFQTVIGAGLLVKTSHSRENIEDGIHPDGSSPRLPLPLGPMRLDAAFIQVSSIVDNLGGFDGDVSVVAPAPTPSGCKYGI
jgi:hypothetical protein